MTVLEFRLAAFTYCVLTGASETQGYRTLAHNVKVGGVAYSPHTFGLAVDVIYDDNAPVINRTEVATRLGLKLFLEVGHDHLQPLDWKPG